MIKYILIGGTERNLQEFLANEGFERREVIHVRRSQDLYGIGSLARNAKVATHESYYDLRRSERREIQDRLWFLRSVGHLSREA